MDLTGRTVVVTGANRGLGRALVDASLAAGAGQVLAGRRTAGGEDALPTGARWLEIDIADAGSVARAADAAAGASVLISNAGVLDYAGPLETTEEILARNLNTNLIGTWRASLAFVPVIEAAGGGAIVNVLSFLSLVAAPIFAAYNASKAASWSMAMSLRGALADRDVKIVNAFPTTIDTAMVAALDKAKDTPEAVAGAIIAGLAAGEEDIYPLGASDVFGAWRADQKAVERRFAGIA